MELLLSNEEINIIENEQWVKKLGISIVSKKPFTEIMTYCEVTANTPTMIFELGKFVGMSKEISFRNQLNSK